MEEDDYYGEEYHRGSHGKHNDLAVIHENPDDE